jgi:hypothetical protein
MKRGTTLRGGRIQRAVGGAVVLATVLTGIAVMCSGSAVAGAVSCSNFKSQAAAQTYFLSHGGPEQDPAGLDADHDGLACESNPPPYRGLLGLSWAGGAFHAGLKSVSTPCIQARTIRVLQAVKNKPDPVVASGQTSNTGEVRIVYLHPRGIFYARSLAKGNCASDQSGRISAGR